MRTKLFCLPHRVALVAATALVAVSTAASAQSGTYAFDIPAQPLSQALKVFARTTGQQIIFNEAALRGKSSRALRGSYMATAAMNELLLNSGLVASRSPRGILVIGPSTQARPVQAMMRPTAEHAAPARAMPAGAAPDSAPADVGEDVQEVVVTAQLRRQSVTKVPISLTVTTGDQLARSNIVDVQDLSTRLPNVKIASSPGAAFLNIRGLGSGNNAGFEQSVGTFVDGVYRGRSRAAAAALFDIERVEVLKGPQTTFFGNNVIAGALNISTVKPGSVLAYNASALASPNDGEYNLEAGVSLPLSDSLSVRLAGKAYGMRGYSYNHLTGSHEPNRDDKLGRFALAWEPTRGWNVEFRIDHGRNRDRGALANELVNCPAPGPYPAPSGLCLRYLNSGQPVDARFNYESAKADSYFNYDFTEVELVNRVQIGSGQLVSTSGYFTHDADILSIGTPLPLNGVGGTPAGATLHFYENIKQYSQQIRYQSDTSGPVSYVLGGYYGHEELSAPLYVGFYFAPFGLFAGPPYTAATPIAGYEPFSQNTDNYSVFGALAVNFTSALTMNLGARYAVTEKSVVRDAVLGTGGPVAGVGNFVAATPAQQAALRAQLGGVPGNFADPRRTDRKFMPSVNLQYALTSRINAYASFTKGFKAGGFAQDFGHVEFGPENVNAYEIGVKGTALGRKLFFAINAFRSNYKGLQEATQNVLPSGVVIPTVSNVGGARAQGVEFSGTLTATHWLSLNADVAYLDARYTDYKNAPCVTLGNTPTCVQDLSGKRRGFAPEWSGNVGATLTLPVGGGNALRLSPSLYFTSRYYQAATADPLLEQSGYAKADMRVGIGPEDRRWELAVIGKNLTDIYTASFRQNIATSNGSIYVVPDRPRSFAIQFSVRQ